MATKIGSNAVVVYGLASEMLSPAGFPLGSLFVVESGQGAGLEYSVGTDGEWFQRSQIVEGGDGGTALRVVGGKVGPAYIRERINVTTREKVTFLPAALVTEVTISVFSTDAAIDDNAQLAITFDSYDDASADAELLESDLEAYDSLREVIQADGKPETFNVFGGCERIDFKALGSETLRVLIRGV